MSDCTALPAERARAAGLEVGRRLGRERLGGVWMDRRPPEHLPSGCWSHWVEGYLQGLRERAKQGGDTPFRAGHAGFLDGFWRSDNPYPPGTAPFEDWLRGWLEARRAATVARRSVTLSRRLDVARP